MTNLIISDFDGTITSKDCLYGFFKEFAQENWLEVEDLWVQGKIGSKECLIREFELVPSLSPELIKNYLKNVELDPYFREFNEFRIKNNIDFVVVSDGVDYFINQILENNNVKNIKIISNHGEFIDGKFKLTFQYENKDCKNNSGTCKCKALNDLSKNYDKITYIGDGVSDFCVAAKADKLFAKASLVKYCREKNIKHIEFKTFKDVIEKL